MQNKINIYLTLFFAFSPSIAMEIIDDAPTYYSKLAEELDTQQSLPKKLYLSDSSDGPILEILAEESVRYLKKATWKIKHPFRENFVQLLEETDDQKCSIERLKKTFTKIISTIKAGWQKTNPQAYEPAFFTSNAFAHMHPHKIFLIKKNYTPNEPRFWNLIVRKLISTNDIECGEYAERASDNHVLGLSVYTSDFNQLNIEGI